MAPPFDGPLGPALLRVIKGQPTSEEIAAVAAVLAALSVRAPTAPATPHAHVAAARWARADATRFPPGSWMSGR
ncbi:acyl-CoA carboxylase epsilon subunit [Streptomyces sp. RKAG293]|uniref:acyl-CoA carboxylase epsilon subunit n=1 Tax=Streptomyces sp. RKAG293 TaxID=2893403 RepID=UPI0020340C1A|nr:acyl-CoA carboxylase epsilon subunit [Streptomyces sp. RKAG293]MCM2422916.1 acyl-CoA carboxylase subunit epsilon [Streptomyces sp. RKAG293]